MTQRPLAAITLFFALVAACSVFLPWYTASLTASSGESREVLRLNGLEDPFLGTWALALSCLGAVGIAWFTFLRTGPALSRGLLALALLCFGATVALAVVDLLREVEEVALTTRASGLQSGRGAGNVVLLAGGLVALLGTVITVASPKTPYRD